MRQESSDAVDPSQSDTTYQELFTGDSLLELCNSFWKPSAKKRNVQPYLRGCRWSPDGTCCLSIVNSDGIHIMELPRDLYEGCPTRERMITLLPAVVHVKEGGLVYDFCWYPKMNSYIPETCSWLTTKKNSPIQLWDAYDGSLRCSYRGYNAVDEMEPALSVTFTNGGSRIVGGYRNCLRTFDVDRPGREFIEHKIKSTASCITTKDRLLAVGSWNTNINLFSISDMGTYKSIGNMHGHTGGITHMQFTPDGTKLVSGARKDNKLLVWDLRYYRKPLNILHRCVQTNQTIYFDISPCGRYLVSGGSDGVISVWDDKQMHWTGQFDVNNAQNNVTFRFHVYEDSCNSISIHPSRPILATGSGQFHFIDPVKVLEQENENSCDDEQTANLQDSTEKLECSSGSVSTDEDTKDTGNVVQVEMQEQSDSNTEFPNGANKLNPTHVDVSNVGSSQDSNETKNELCVNKMNIKRPIEESNMDLSNEIIEMNEGEDCLEPPCKRRMLEMTLESSMNINLDTDINASSNIGCEQFSLNETHNISVENNKEHSDIMKIDEERLNKIDSDISNSRCKEEEISNTGIVFEGIKDTLHESPDLCRTDNGSKCHTKSHNLKESDKLKLHAPRKLDKTTKDSKDSNGNELMYSAYAENNLTFWWIAKVSEEVQMN